MTEILNRNICSIRIYVDIDRYTHTKENEKSD